MKANNMSKWLEKQRRRELEEQMRNQSSIALLPEFTQSFPEGETRPVPPERLYGWVAGDNIWQVSARLGIDPYELMEHNDIQDYKLIDPGTILRLPVARKVEIVRPIQYEIFPMPRVMHVTHEGGTHKVMFADVRKWEDIKPTGALYPFNRNVTVDGIAHVPVGDETAAFYMDKLAIGDYLKTGKVRYTIGFNSAHLADGRVAQFVSPPTPKVALGISKATEKLNEQIAEDALKEGVRPSDLVPEEPIAPQVGLHLYKTTFVPFNEERKPVLFVLTEDLDIEEFDTVRPDRSMPAGTVVSLLGTFIKDGQTYGRPSNTVYWFGVPMDKVVPNDEVEDNDEDYEYAIDLPTRTAMGKRARLTAWERYVTIPIYKIANGYLRTRDWIKNKQIKEQ